MVSRTARPNEEVRSNDDCRFFHLPPRLTFTALRVESVPTQELSMDTAWLIADPEPYDDYDLGPIKTGKEAEVFLVERVAPDGRSCLLAHKRYRPRSVRYKGELQALGFQRAANFVNDRGVPRWSRDPEQS